MIGHLHCFWYWALDYCQDGRLEGYTPDEIADGAIGGRAGAVLRALTDCGFGSRPGFIEMAQEGLIIHDWFTTPGKLIEKRR
jgi:hypothetical protein